MSEQFSKLNKLGHTIAGKKTVDSSKSEAYLDKNKKSIEQKVPKPMFTVGNRDIEGNRKSRSNSGSSASSHDFNERLMMESNDLEDADSLSRAYLLSLGIPAGPENNRNSEEERDKGNDSISNRTFDCLNLIPPGNAERCSSTGNIDRTGATTPEITIQSAGDNGPSDDKERAVPPSSLNLPKNISHSSGEVDNRIPGNVGNSGCLQVCDRLICPIYRLLKRVAPMPLSAFSKNSEKNNM